MRFVQLTPGTGSFYCGTCLRDNALVVEMRRQGHDAMLVPLYLPPSLDEAAANPEAPIFYGGINVYLQQKSSLFRRTPRWLDRYLDAPGVLRLAARGSGMTSARELGELTLSTLLGENGLQVKELERLVEWLAPMRPDVICLSNILLIGLAGRLREATGARVFCTLQGEAPFLDSLPQPQRDACWSVLGRRSRHCDGFVAVSRYYARELIERAGLPADRVHVVYNGINLEGFAPRHGAPTPPTLGFLSRMCAGKGLETLVDAYLRLRREDRVPGLRLHVGGSCTASDEAFVAGLKAKLRAAGVEGDTAFSPNLDREGKIEFLRGLTAMSVPAPYGESFGLYLLEAWAAGVPVVQPDHAAFPEVLGESGGGLLYPLGDEPAYVEALATVCGSPDRSDELGRRGRSAVERKFTIEQMATACIEVFAGGGKAADAAAPER